MNINDTVWVRLNDKGRRIHREHWTEVMLHATNWKYAPPVEDANGWSRWQLWSLMEIFGPHIQLGCTPPFSTEIRLEPPQLREAPFCGICGKTVNWMCHGIAFVPRDRAGDYKLTPPVSRPKEKS